MQRSRLPLMLSLIAFCLTLLSGSYGYRRLIQPVPILTAARDIPLGTPLTPELVRLIHVPAGGQPAGALLGPGQIAGRYASVALFAGEFLTERHVTQAPPSQDPLVALSPDLRIISIPVAWERVLGGTLSPGDIVDVTVAWPSPEGASGREPVETLAAGIRVIDVQRSEARDSPSAVLHTAVLLQVNSQEARAIVGAVEADAALYLWLAGRDPL